MKKSIFFIGMLMFVFSLFCHQEKTKAASLQEWIIYFDNQANYFKFVDEYRDRIEDAQEGFAIRAKFSLQEIEQIKHLHIVSQVEPNYKKSLASTISFNDPLLSEQWGLEKIDVNEASMPFTRKNLLHGKHFVINNETIQYEEQPLHSLHFEVLSEETPLSRISVELDHIEGPWSLEVLDEQGVLVAANTGELARLDVLLPKGNTYSSLQISIKHTEQWNQQPVVKKVIGVNHVLVAVIDTGAALHKDFCDNVLHSLGKDYVDEEGMAIDENGHGTHVTGIIAACPNNGEGIAGATGFAPVDIVPLKALDKNGSGNDFDVAQAVNDAAQLHVSIINLSLAGKGETLILREAIQEALQQNIIVVAAAGNWKTSTETIYPASYPGVITVAAANESDNTVSYSNYGWEVDISAPGSNIISTYLNDSYQSLGGTSMAAPFVTSAVAFLRASNPELDLIQVRQRLFQSALDIKAKGYDIYSGHGIVQISKAMHLPLSDSIDWLTMKDNQQIDFSKQQILGLSSGLIGKNIYLFMEGKLVSTFIGTNSWLYLNLPWVESTRNERNVEVIAADQSGKVLALDKRTIKTATGENWQSFSDVPQTYWAYEEIQRAYSQRFINGFSDGTFRPNEYLKRRHGLMMIDRLFSWPLDSINTPFKDTPIELSGALSIYSAYEQQVIKGYNDGNFYPENLLTRAQMAVILARALKLSETSYNGTIYPFKDLSNPEHFAYYAVQQLANIGIITKQDYFRPNDYITRAQFAAMVMRTYDYLQSR
jgi:hypothetical protein